MMRRLLESCKHVLRVAKKPSKEEFIDSLKVCGGGMILLGVMGFLFYLIFALVGV